ncbi:hypothetical protein K7X08_011671 [Anisodus acutangulus]|uniref:Uncharacterized protein n=1 Tax=Anisodus acutangulus TaxID=402998 RepID=A0A9Q1MK02_9SOLA|nr:hypothetical protein K7X08_011671 [Anisodus acutangulus]
MRSWLNYIKEESNLFKLCDNSNPFDVRHPSPPPSSVSLAATAADKACKWSPELAVACEKCKWQKENTVGRKVTNGMDLANILTNVASIASTGLELNMVLVRKIMLVIATLLAINHKEL